MGFNYNAGSATSCSGGSRAGFFWGPPHGGPGSGNRTILPIGRAGTPFASTWDANQTRKRTVIWLTSFGELKLPPVALLYHEAWGWTMQDRNHHHEALARAGAARHNALLGEPKKKRPIDVF